MTHPAVVPNVIADTVQSLAYGDVELRPRLLEQRFLLNRDYLLSLNNDSLLYLFRKRAGLPTPGKPYGGWCTVEGIPWPHNGEFQGDYLAALLSCVPGTRGPVGSVPGSAVLHGRTAADWYFEL